MPGQENNIRVNVYKQFFWLLLGILCLNIFNAFLMATKNHYGNYQNQSTQESINPHNTNTRLLQEQFQIEDDQTKIKKNTYSKSTITPDIKIENTYEIIDKYFNDNMYSYLIQYKGNESYVKTKSSPIIHFLNFSYTYFSQNELSLKIADANITRWEIPKKDPFPYRNKSYIPIDDSSICCIVEVISNPFAFYIIRKSTNETIYNTSAGNFIYSDLYIKLTTSLPTPHIYGLGERAYKYKLGPTGVYTIHTYDMPNSLEDGNTGNNLYGHHPVYLQKEKMGMFDVILVNNVNAMDFEMKKGKTLTYHLTGGIIHVEFFFGDSNPETAIKLYHEYLGGWILQPFWTMGFHQSRWGYTSLQSLADVVYNYRNYDLPLDSIWSDLDYMVNKEIFTVNRINFPIYAFRDFLKNTDIRWVPIIDAGVKIPGKAYEEGKKRDVFIKNYQGKDLIGWVWPGAVHFTDFLHPKADDYWCDMLKELYQLIPFDGIWLDMNEIAQFIDGEKDRTELGKYDKLPYTPGGRMLKSKTISMDAMHYGGILEYNVHNLYGLIQTASTYKCLKNNSNMVFLLSRSTTFGSGKYAAHWTGDNGVSWDFLKVSISSIFSFNLFGIPFTGADVCGFIGAPDATLCARWMQLGAFYPFSRHHNSIEYEDKEPYKFGPQILEVAKRSLKLRYSLLKWYYTQFVQKGGYGTIFKPLFYEFFDDEFLYTDEAEIYQTQFLIGSHLMIAPIVEITNYVDIYFPKDKWYNFYTGEIVSEKDDKPKKLRNFVPLNEDIPIYIKAGSILHVQNVDYVKSTKDLNDRFILIIALTQIRENIHEARGAIMAIKNFTDNEIYDRCIIKNCIINIVATVEKGEKDSKIDILFIAEDNNQNLDEIGIDQIKFYGLQSQKYSIEHNQDIYCLYQHKKIDNDVYDSSNKNISKFNNIQKYSYELEFETPMWVTHGSHILAFAQI